MVLNKRDSRQGGPRAAGSGDLLQVRGGSVRGRRLGVENRP